MATAGAHPNAGHAPDARCVFPEQTPRIVSGVLEPAFSDFSRRSSGSRRPRALDYRPPRRGNLPTPASSAFDRRAPRGRSKRVRAPEAAPDARHGAAATDRSARAGGYARARGRGGADARAETRRRRDCAPRRASRRRFTLRGDGFEPATFNGLKGPRRGSKRARPGRAAAFFFSTDGFF
jgi:hypothetical protein